MQHGNISNERSYVFGFRCEGSLLNYRTSLKDRVVNLFVGKTHNAEINEDILSLMKYIYWNTEYTVLLVIDEKNYTSEAQRFIQDLPFNQVVNVRSVSEITMMLNTGELTYYVDDDPESRYAVQSKYAITSAELNTVLRRHYGRLT